MWQRVTETYTIDLRRPPEDRWAEVIADELPAAKLMFEAAMASLSDVYFPRLTRACRWAFAQAYAHVDTEYRREVRAWSDALGVPFADVLSAQFVYELSHAGEWLGHRLGRLRKLLPNGCTAGMIWADGYGPMHVRSMDWPIPEIGPATRLFRFVEGPHEFTTVGMLGYVGVISGIVKGAYSATMNWAPPTGLPGFAKPAAFLLREAFREAKFWDAVRVLETTPLATNVMYAICGAQQGACRVIERTRDRAAIRNGGMPEKWPVCVANHFETSQFSRFNILVDEDPELREDSLSRVQALAAALVERRAAPKKIEFLRALYEAPVTGCWSVQRMAFDVRGGGHWVTARV